jgi:hypothetical protein
MSLRWSPREELSAWGRAFRGAVLTLLLLGAGLVVLRIAGPRGLLVATAVGAVMWWLARLGRPRA